MKKLLLFLALACSCAAQTWTGHSAGTPATWVTQTITSAPIYVANQGGAGNDGFKMFVTHYSYTQFNQNPPAANDGLWGWGTNTGGTFLGHAVTWTASGGAYICNIGTTDTTTLRASGGSFVLGSSINAQNGVSTIALSGSSCTWSVSAAGAVSGGPAIPIGQKEVVIPYTNNTSAAQLVGLFQFTTASESATTGVVLQSQWISPGGSWTFNLVVGATDPNWYDARPIDLTKQAGVQPFYEGPFTDWQGATPLNISSTGAQNWATGSALTTLPGQAQTPGGVMSDGGYSSGFSVGQVAGPGAIALGTGATVTPSTVSASGGGTNGGGGGGASDAGLVNNAAAINTGIAAAATSLNTNLANGFNAITGQEAKDTANLVGQLQANALAGSGSVSVSNVGGGSASSVASSADVQNAPHNSETYSATSAGAAYAASVSAAYATNAAADAVTTNGLAATAGAAVDSGTLGAAATALAASSAPVPAGSSFATSPHNAPVTDSFVKSITGSNYDSNPLTSGLLGGVVSNSTATTFIGWIFQLILWAAVLGFLVKIGRKVFEIVRACMSAAPAPLSWTASFLAESQVAGTSVGIGYAVAIQIVAAGLFATALLAAPILVVAGMESKFGVTLYATTLTTSAATAAGLPGLADIMSYVFLILPVDTLAVIMIENFVLENASVVLLVVVGFALRIMRL